MGRVYGTKLLNGNADVFCQTIEYSAVQYAIGAGCGEHRLDFAQEERVGRPAYLKVRCFVQAMTPDL
jgi:hypothetical protein